MTCCYNKLDFDSQLFGYEVASLRLCVENLDCIDTVLDNEEYKLLYIFPEDKESNNILIQKGFTPIDIKVTYSKDLKSVSFENVDCKNIEFYNCNEVTDDLSRLAYLSGQFSRFKIDSNFKNCEFEKLYDIWITKSIRKEIATNTLIFKIDNCIVGFLTYKIDNLICKIGLIAVDQNYRNKRIAFSLMKQLELLCKQDNITQIEVPTQFANIIARKFYSSLGYIESKKEIIYHIWK